MSDKLTPETILAVLEHEETRRREIEAAMGDCRPNAYSSVFSILTHTGDIRVGAEFETRFRDDGRPDWVSRHEGTDFDALCDQVLADIAAYKEDMFGSDIERLALAIIRIKHTDGVVTDRALRMENFTQECITAIHERAAQLANEMSDGKPFEVEFTGACNEESA
jgi:hypothetical protein